MSRTPAPVPTPADLSLLTEIARALAEVRLLRENALDATDRFGMPPSRSLANALLDEIECRHRSTASTLEHALRSRGIAPGVTAADAARLQRDLNERCFRAP